MNITSYKKRTIGHIPVLPLYMVDDTRRRLLWSGGIGVFSVQTSALPEELKSFSTYDNLHIIL